MGASYDKDVSNDYGIYDDNNLNNYINYVGQKLVKQVHRKNLNYHFKVLDAAEVNAFAVPGGYIYITRGLLAYLNNEAQLAAVLGHELGHVNARHSAKQMTNSMLGQFGLLAGTIAVPELQNYQEVISSGVQLLFLKFSRSDEVQADHLGVVYSSKAGYDSFEMAKFFETLERLEPKSSGKLPEWASTHPNPDNRIDNVERDTLQIRSTLPIPKSEYAVLKEQFIKNIDGMTFGDDPREGFYEDGYFYHPVLKFKFIVPDGFKVQNSKSKVLITPQQKDSVIVFHLTNGRDLDSAINQFRLNRSIKVYSYSNVIINNLKAVKVVSSLVQNKMLLVSYFIQKGDKIYQFDSFYKNFPERYQFIPMSFSALFDPHKLDRKPKRIKVIMTTFHGSLKKHLAKFNINDPKDVDKIALLNGIYADTVLKEGELIKIIK